MQAPEIISKLNCTLLPGTYARAGAIPPLYEAVYNYWRKTWGEFFEKAGSGPNALNVENFMRSRFIIVLHRELQVAGTLSSSVFNTHADVSFDHPSVKPFPEPVKLALRESTPNACITGEYLSVGREFKRDLVGISLADVMVGILLEILKSEELSAMIATPVRAAKVADITINFGAIEVGSHMKIGVDCQMIYVGRNMVRPHPDAKVNHAVEDLWNRRIDMTKPMPNLIPLKRVA